MGLVQKLREISRASGPQSLPSRFRKKRFDVFTEMTTAISYADSPPIKVCDFGGTAAYWDQVYDIGRNPLNLDVTLVNYYLHGSSDDRFKYIQADVRDLSHMEHRSFDISFSNSLIEHVGDLATQSRVVSEMLRVSRYLYLQTPNRGFFWEPHYALPFVHWLSLPIRMRLLSIVAATSVRQQYDAYVKNPVRLLSRSELLYLFPLSQFEHIPERIGGMTKSWVIRSALNTLERSGNGEQRRALELQD